VQKTPTHLVWPPYRVSYGLWGCRCPHTQNSFFSVLAPDSYVRGVAYSSQHLILGSDPLPSLCLCLFSRVWFFLIWCCLLFKRLRKICMNLTSCSVKQNKGSIRKCSEKTKSVGKHTRSVGKYSALEYKSMESMGHIHQGERSSLEKWTCWIDMYKCINV
jgi:hypothetical protein